MNQTFFIFIYNPKNFIYSWCSIVILGVRLKYISKIFQFLQLLAILQDSSFWWLYLLFSRLKCIYNNKHKSKNIDVSLCQVKLCVRKKYKSLYIELDIEWKRSKSLWTTRCESHQSLCLVINIFSYSWKGKVLQYLWRSI